MWRNISRAIFGAATLLSPIKTWAADYYFSSVGSDALGDGSSAHPWKSISKFNSLDLNAGDGIYFRAGDTFVGRLSLDEQDSGVDTTGSLVAPIRIGSYDPGGSLGRATIRSPNNSEAFVAFNAGGIEVRDLEFSSGGSAPGSRKSGLLFYTDKSPAGQLNRLHHLRVSNVASHGFGSSGVEVYAADGVGFADVQIVDSEFYGNAYGGVTVGAARWQELIHADVLVDRVQSHDNPGYSGCAPHCGHGAMLGQVDGGVIQNSVARDNGVAFGRGNVALWAWQSNDVTIQRNVAFGNRSPAGGDGGAFDLDGGVTNSFIQYNRSYDNDGAGLLLAQFGGADSMSQNTIRYNLSINDGRGAYGGITIWGESPGDATSSAVIHNNTVVIDASVAPDAKGVLWFVNGNHDDVALFNNAFIALNGATLIAGNSSTDKSSIFGNAYWTGGEPLRLEDVVYSSVAKWAMASGQETVSGEFAAVLGDSAFLDLVSFRPKAYSSLVDAGFTPVELPWPSWSSSFGANDLGGIALFQDTGYEVGAWEIVVADYDGDGRVNDSDLQFWRTRFGVNGIVAQAADLDGDGEVDGSEFLTWQRRFSVVSNRASRFVPEPPWNATLFIELGVAVVLAARRRTPHSQLCERWKDSSLADAPSQDYAGDCRVPP